MMPQTERTSGIHQAVRPRTVAVVSCHPHAHAIGTVLGAVDHDVVLVEPTAHAYSHIKHIRPDLVIVLLTNEDYEGCQVLSMLTVDRETSGIPILTHVLASDDDALVDWAVAANADVEPVTALSLN